ncbi:MAG: hypothetical protein KKA44_07120 [Alphaproteobacteria bacterium]|nr:hypothetical protein [Alphaproteobacteria bacterium]MBU0864185.1 hypothetical protein [Alphaproteobacteria bacterium]MBU1824731.1 hypothetical protein [Alphaproteobacteria bacterium]
MNTSLGKVLGIMVGLIPILYIGWLLYYFVGVGGGTAEGVAGIGLGPTVIGLSIVGLLFALPLIIKLLRATTGVNRVPGASFDAKLKPGEVVVEPEFDADAAFASYMRKREAGVVGDVTVDPADDAPAPFSQRPASFGRKTI